jgi:hypothetical protein
MLCAKHMWKSVMYALRQHPNQFTSLHNEYQTEQNFNILLWCMTPCSLVEMSISRPEYLCYFLHPLFILRFSKILFFDPVISFFFILLISSHSNTNWPFSGPQYFLYFIHHKHHQGLDPLIRSVSSYNCCRLCSLVLPIVLLPFILLVNYPLLHPVLF